MAERQGGVAVVENDTAAKRRAGRIAESFEPTEVAFTDGRRRFDLDAADQAAVAFDHNIDLQLILVPVVEKADGFRLSRMTGDVRRLSKLMESKYSNKLLVSFILYEYCSRLE